MSSMNFLEKLLDGVEVAWKTLGEVATITIGEFVHKNNQDPSAQYPVYNGGTSPTGYYDKYNNTGDKIIVSARGANAGFVNRISKPYWAGNSCYSIGIKNAAELNWIFVYYFLKRSEIMLIGDQQKGGIPAVSKKQIEIFQIPIPCPESPDKSLKIQAEIVRILDAFTSLTAELTAELTARKKQYNYYRAQLLSFEDGEVKWKTLGEVCDFKNGFAFKSSLFRETGLPIIRITNINGANVDLTDVKFFNPSDYKENTKSYEISKGDILIAMSGATTGKIGYYNNEKKAYLNQRVGKFIPKIKLLNNRYLYHSLLSKTEEIYVLAGGGAQPNLSSNALMAKIQIPIPYPDNPVRSLKEQEHFAIILDKFDALTNSISEGLPREIEFRQKQYEYYRDLLLSFPKPEVEA